MRLRLSIALVLLLLLAPSPSWANPLDAFGFGARAIAIGGAATSIASDFSATYYNPAGLADNDALRLEIGYAFVEPFLKINDGDLDVDPSRGIQGGIVLPGTLFDRRVAVSLGLFLPDGLISRVRSLPQIQPRFALFDNRPQRLVISTSVALEVIDGLFLGAGLTYISNTKGTLDLTGAASISDERYTKLFSSVDIEFSAVRYPSVGVLFAPEAWKNWRFGLTYRHEFVLELDLGVSVRGDITLGEEEAVAVEDGSFLLDSFNSNLFSPRQVVFGVAHVRDGWLVSFDLAWLQWSRFPAPISALTLTLDLGDLDFDVPVPDSPVDPNFHDILVPRLGAEVEILRTEAVALLIRGGYFFEASPAPDQPGLTNYVDSAKHGLSLGVGIELSVFDAIMPRPLVIDLAGQTILLTPTEVTKSDPADPVGDYRANGHFFGGATTVRFLF